jgi:putative DNA primase/helicase
MTSNVQREAADSWNEDFDLANPWTLKEPMGRFAGAPEAIPDNVTPIAKKRAPRKKEAASKSTVAASGQVRVAEEFARRYKFELIHVDGVGWHRWAGSHWRPVPDKLAQASAQQLLGALLREAIEYDPDTRDQWFSDIRRCESASGLAGVCKIASGMAGISIAPERVDDQPDLVAFRNATYDLRTDEVRPSDPKDLITKVMGCDYIPEATCPWYDKMLADSQPDEAIRDYLHRQVGSALEGRVREHMLSVCCGTGGNGKGSTLNDSWLPVFGDYGISMNVEVLLASGAKDYITERLALKGARYVVTSEPKATAKFNAALVKLIAGGDRMSVRPLYSNHTVNWEPSHQVFMLCNFRPEPPADDGGMWRRLKPVDWLHTVPEDQMDGDLPQKLRGELAGIAQRILAGWRDFRDKGLQVPESAKQIVAEWRSDVDTLGRFLDEKCVVDKSKDYRTKSSLLYLKWSSYCQVLNEEPGSNKAFSQALKRKGFVIERITAGMHVKGVALCDDMTTNEG